MGKSFAGYKYALIIVVTIFSIVYALPNIYGKSAAVQMQFTDTQSIEKLIPNIEEQLRNSEIPYQQINVQGDNLDITFANVDLQSKAATELRDVYPDANIAMNLLPNTPTWMQYLDLKPMNLGLDLRGGVSFLLQVDTNELFARRSANLIDLSTQQAKKLSLPLLSSKVEANGGATLSFQSSADRTLASESIYSLLPQGVQYRNQDENGNYNLILSYTEQALNIEKMQAADQNRIRLANRVNSLGVAEPSVQVVGNDRISIELPGIQDVTQAKNLIGSTATLEFYLGYEATAAELQQASLNKVAPFGTKIVYDERGVATLVKRNPIMSGEHIIDAGAEISQPGSGSTGPVVSVLLDNTGGSQMAEITRENLGEPIATVYVEYVPVTYVDKDGNEQSKVEKHETLVNQANIQGEFSNRFQISGVSPYTQAQKLAQTLKSGSLVAPVYIIEEQTIGPSAGKQNIDQGIKAAILGVLLITLFMLIYYRKLGLWADIALISNLILLVALMSLIGATLSLPGIAGIILTLGMAIDANVLIYERIREELNTHQHSIKEAVRLGFDEAFSTIVDANITTLIVAIVLFSFGVGPIKGFAVTLSIGILTSMFSAIFVTRGLVEFLLLRREQPKLKM